jgi:hypothetical protein
VKSRGSDSLQLLKFFDQPVGHLLVRSYSRIIAQICRKNISAFAAIPKKRCFLRKETAVRSLGSVQNAQETRKLLSVAVIFVVRAYEFNKSSKEMQIMVDTLVKI